MTAPNTLRLVAPDTCSPAPAQKSLLTTREVADALGCSAREVLNLIDDGELNGHSIGRKKVIYAASVQAFKERHAFKAKAPTEINPVRATKKPGKGPATTGLKHLRLQP